MDSSPFHELREGPRALDTNSRSASVESGRCELTYRSGNQSGSDSERLPEHPISLDHLRQIHTSDDGTYSALLDAFEYSLIYRMFDGNIFAEMRAHVADTLCRVVDGHPNAFSGPFAALSDNFIRRLVAQLKSRVRLAAPACNVSDDLVRAYEQPTPADERLLPFVATFQKCLEATTSMAQCVATNDAP